MFSYLKEKLKKVITTFTKQEEAPPSQHTAIPEAQPAPSSHDEKKSLPKRISETKKILQTKEATKKETLPSTSLPKKQELLQEVQHSPPEPETLQETPKEGFFSKLTAPFTTTTLTKEKIEEFTQELELALLENNVAYDVVQKLKKDLENALTGTKISRGKGQELITTTLTNSIREVLSIPTYTILEKAEKKKPFIICFVGINGSGKTTTIAKISKLFLNNNKSVVLAAGDTFRAAAIDQLQHHADALNVKLIKHSYGADPAAVAYDAVQHSLQKNFDVVLIDTAGRLHTNTNLIDELKKIKRVAKPDLTIFVGESITGNDCIEQAQHFNTAIGIDGIILTKSDVDEKGGAPLSISYVTRKPILYLGTGQEYADLKEFNPERIIEQLL